MIFGKKNQRETMPEGATRQGARPRGWACPGPSWPLRKVVGALLSLQESQYPDKNRVKISAQSELGISGNIRNGERVVSVFWQWGSPDLPACNPWRGSASEGVLD